MSVDRRRGVAVHGVSVAAEAGRIDPPPPSTSIWRDWIDFGTVWKSYSYGKAAAGLIDWIAKNLLRGTVLTPGESARVV